MCSELRAFLLHRFVEGKPPVLLFCCPCCDPVSMNEPDIVKDLMLELQTWIHVRTLEDRFADPRERELAEGRLRVLGETKVRELLDAVIE